MSLMQIIDTEQNLLPQKFSFNLRKLPLWFLNLVKPLPSWQQSWWGHFFCCQEVNGVFLIFNCFNIPHCIIIAFKWHKIVCLSLTFLKFFHVWVECASIHVFHNHKYLFSRFKSFKHRYQRLVVDGIHDLDLSFDILSTVCFLKPLLFINFYSNSLVEIFVQSHSYVSIRALSNFLENSINTLPLFKLSLRFSIGEVIKVFNYFRSADVS